MKISPADEKSSTAAGIWQSSVGLLEFSRQVAVDLEADADFDKGWGSPGHGYPPYAAVMKMSNETPRRDLTTNCRIAAMSVRVFARFEGYICAITHAQDAKS
jgi:hypothetical protein